MDKRIWDKKGIYKDLFLKEFNHWILELSCRQHTLGSFILFAKRSIETITQLTDKEITDFLNVLQEVEHTWLKIPDLNPDRFNYLQMGNALHHLHIHGIPRYKAPRKFNGIEWVDQTWGHPPVWKKEDSDKKLVLGLKGVVLHYLVK